MLTIINVIISLFAVFSSLLTTLIHNKHQERLKYLEFEMNKYYNNKIHYRDIFENYLKYTGHCVLSYDDAPLDKYSEYYYLVLMCSPDHISVSIKYINELIRDQKLINAKHVLDELIPLITELMKSL